MDEIGPKTDIVAIARRVLAKKRDPLAEDSEAEILARGVLQLADRMGSGELGRMPLI